MDATAFKKKIWNLIEERKRINDELTSICNMENVELNPHDEFYIYQPETATEMFVRVMHDNQCILVRADMGFRHEVRKTDELFTGQLMMYVKPMEEMSTKLKVYLEAFM